MTKTEEKVYSKLVSRWYKGIATQAEIDQIKVFKKQQAKEWDRDAKKLRAEAGL